MIDIETEDEAWSRALPDVEDLVEAAAAAALVEIDFDGGALTILLTADESIRELNARGIAILLVEQNAKQALKLAQRGYVLESGSITCAGPACELLNDKRVQEAYLGA